MTPPDVEICPWCGAQGRTPWGTCQACNRHYFRHGWTHTPRRRAGRLALWLGLGTVLLAWLYALFLPAPFIMLFNRPTTQLSSMAPPHHWPMSGLELQQRRYVADVPQPIAGRLAWSLDLGTPTRSVPVIVDDVIYLGGHFTLGALDAHTGQRRWELPMTGPVHTSPAVAGAMLYIGLQDWRVLAVNRHTGTLLWEFPMRDPVAGAAAVAQGLVYIGSTDGFLYALDAATGKLIWKFKTQEHPLSPPAIEAGTLFLSSTDGSLYSLNARTGRSKLRFRTLDRLQDTPVLANGLVYFPSGGKLYAVAAGARELPGQYALTYLWAHFWMWGFPLPPPPGQPGSRWRVSPRHPAGKIISSPAMAPEALYVGDTHGVVYAREALQGKELWQFQAAGSVLAAPLILGAWLYFGTDAGWLYALERTRGTLLWKLACGAPIHATPVFASGRLYIRTTDGRLHAIE